MTAKATRKYRTRRRVEEAPREWWEEYAATGDQGLYNQLIEHYLPLVRYHAERVASDKPQSVDVDDLYSEGIFGLMDAVKGFDVNHGTKFKTYCVRRVTGAMQDSLRKFDFVPRNVRKKAKSLRKAIDELELRHGREPSDIELADHLEMDICEFDSLVSDANATRMVSLSDSFRDNGDGGRALTNEELVADQRIENPAAKLMLNEAMEFILGEVEMRERMIVLLYYLEEQTMREIGETLGLSESRVCQLLRRVRERLAQRFDGRRADFLG